MVAISGRPKSGKTLLCKDKPNDALLAEGAPAGGGLVKHSSFTHTDIDSLI